MFLLLIACSYFVLSETANEIGNDPANATPSPDEIAIAQLDPKEVRLAQSRANRNNRLFNPRCFQWTNNDGSDCSSWLPNIDLVPTSNVINYTSCCNDGTGCFSINRNTPWECHLFLPTCLDSIRPTFTLYTQAIPNGQQIMFSNLAGSIGSLLIDSTKPLYVVVHGYGSSWFGKPWMEDVKDELVAMGNNVIIVIWSGGSAPPYFKAVANARVVGKGIALVVKAMVDKKKADLSSTTIVGFSLGAHIAGYAGYELKSLKKIIALDPAGPMFSCYHADARLDATDAAFVEVIHTNGDAWAMGGMGTLQRLGNVDYYANGGWAQPGCPRGVPQVVTDILKLDFSSMQDDISCNHARAFKLFIESVKAAAKPEQSCQFAAFPCDNSDKFDAGDCFKCTQDKCPIAGYLTDNTVADGKYYFKTNDQNSPQYCGQQYLISLTSKAQAYGSISVTLFNENGASKTIAFQGSSDTLYADTPKKMVFVSPWEMQKITRARLTYNRNNGWITGLFFGGTTQWTLASATVTNTKFQTVRNQKYLTVADNVPLDMVLA